MDKKPIGKITHYFDKIGVAVIELDNSLTVGDEITIGDDENSFTQKVKSMQVEHEEIEKAKKGDSVGLKVKKDVKPNWKVYK
jgi:U32 family peptidase